SAGQSADDQDRGSQPYLQPEPVGPPSDGSNRYAGGKETQPGSDPGQEGAFVSKGESWVGLRACRVHAPRPAAVAVLRRRAHTCDASADRRRRRQSKVPGWPSTTEMRMRTAPNNCPL